MIINNNKNNKGFALVETLVALFILTLVLFAAGAFQADVFNFTRVISTSLSAQTDVRKIIRPMVDEVRSASESNLGAYPIAQAATSTFIFYSDIDNDSLKERVRYFLDGSDFKKGVIKPSGNPYSYDSEDETITEVVHDIVSTDAIFEYFDSNYDGTASSTPLSDPVSPSDVKLVKIELTVDADPNKDPAPFTVTTQMTIRNLRDNI